jgi:cytochrome c553
MTRSIMMGICIALSAYAGYTQAQGDAGAGKQKAEACSGCHGEDGNATAPLFPKLAGQHASYLARQLSDYRAQKRIDPTMNAMAESLSDADIADLSAYFTQFKIKAENGEPSALGEKVYRAGDPSRDVPACAGCHSPSGAGNPASVYPALGGQYSAYISKTLRDYRGGERTNDPNEIMRTIASRLSEDEINAVSDYVSGLK